MESRLFLRVPSMEDMWFRRAMLEDPATMSYNRGYSLDTPDYDPVTGCIAFPPDRWEQWRARWVGKEPERFYAYLVRKTDGAFLGEVCLRRDGDDPRYEMGIVLYAPFRGRGYAREGLRLLLKQAFECLGAETVTNCFEVTRAAALRIHKAAGFTQTARKGDLIELLMTRERFIGRFSE